MRYGKNMQYIARLAQSVEHQTFKADITQTSEGRGFESHVGRIVLNVMLTLQMPALYVSKQAFFAIQESCLVTKALSTYCLCFIDN